MRIFIAVLVLIFSLQSLSKSDDISNFQIEGMSVGDSLLNYVTKEKIIKNIRSYYENFSSDNFYATGLNENFFKVYDSVDIHLKKNDNKYKIYSLDGLIFYEDINICYKKMTMYLWVKNLDLMFYYNFCAFGVIYYNFGAEGFFFKSILAPFGAF